MDPHRMIDQRDILAAAAARIAALEAENAQLRAALAALMRPAPPARIAIPDDPIDLYF